MDKLDGKALFVGAVSWLGLILIWIDSAACLKSSSCDGGDLFLFAIVAVGMLVPSYFIAYLVSSET